MRTGETPQPKADKRGRGRNTECESAPDFDRLDEIGGRSEVIGNSNLRNIVNPLVGPVGMLTGVSLFDLTLTLEWVTGVGPWRMQTRRGSW